MAKVSNAIGKFENVGVCEFSKTKRSIRFLFNNGYSVFDSYFYVSVKDLEDVLNGRKKSATLWKPKDV